MVSIGKNVVSFYHGILNKDLYFLGFTLVEGNAIKLAEQAVLQHCMVAVNIQSIFRALWIIISKYLHQKLSLHGEII